MDSPRAGAAEMQLRIIEAHEAERSRLAKEIHDGPAQTLTNAIFRVEYIQKLIEQEPKLARAELGSLRDLLNRQLGELRAFISELRPPLLDELGLDGALRDTVDDLTHVSPFEIELHLDVPADRLDEAEQTVVLRVVQEALQNVRKHAGAKHVAVTTKIDGGDWVVEIADDGLGFDVRAMGGRARHNFGLQFMRDRASLIGARFEVRSSPTGGTVVRLAIPVAASEGERG